MDHIQGVMALGELWLGSAGRLYFIGTRTYPKNTLLTTVSSLLLTTIVNNWLETNSLKSDLSNWALYYPRVLTFMQEIKVFVPHQIYGKCVFF